MQPPRGRIIASERRDVQSGGKTRRLVVVAAVSALLGLLLVVILGVRCLLSITRREAIAAKNETMAGAAGDTRPSTDRPLSPAPTGSSSTPALRLPSGMDPHRTEEIRRALAALSDAGLIGLGALWAPPTTGAPAASATAFIPEPDMTQHNQADAGLGTYITKRIHADFYPLAGQCYDAALARTPDLHGRMTLKMKVVGDHKVGAVIDSTEIDDSSEIMDPEFRTCLKESAMTINFAPPPEGTKEITSTFSMTFAPGPPGGK